jgi:uncharacterized protein YggE
MNDVEQLIRVFADADADADAVPEQMDVALEHVIASSYVVGRIQPQPRCPSVASNIESDKPIIILSFEYS